MSTPKELLPALRQFKHNNGSNGDELFHGYDLRETNKAFAQLMVKNEVLEKRCKELEKCGT